MLKEPAKIAKESARQAGVYCMNKESGSKADFNKKEDSSALANAACGQRRNPSEPLDALSEIGFSGK